MPEALTPEEKQEIGSLLLKEMRGSGKLTLEEELDLGFLLAKGGWHSKDLNSKEILAAVQKDSPDASALPEGDSSGTPASGDVKTPEKRPERAGNSVSGNKDFSKETTGTPEDEVSWYERLSEETPETPEDEVSWYEKLSEETPETAGDPIFKSGSLSKEGQKAAIDLILNNDTPSEAAVDLIMSDDTPSEASDDPVLESGNPGDEDLLKKMPEAAGGAESGDEDLSKKTPKAAGDAESGDEDLSKKTPKAPGGAESGDEDLSKKRPEAAGGAESGDEDLSKKTPEASGDAESGDEDLSKKTPEASGSSGSPDSGKMAPAAPRNSKKSRSRRKNRTKKRAPAGPGAAEAAIGKGPKEAAPPGGENIPLEASGASESSELPEPSAKTGSQDGDSGEVKGRSPDLPGASGGKNSTLEASGDSEPSHLPEASAEKGSPGGADGKASRSPEVSGASKDKDERSRAGAGWTKKKWSRKKKIILGVAAALLSVIAIIALVVVIGFNHFFGLTNFKKDEDVSVYTIDDIQKAAVGADEAVAEEIQEILDESDVLSEDEQELIREQLYAINLPDNKAVYNLLLIGADRRVETWYGNSDAMILISINSDTKTIHMTSFMRDLYAVVPGFGGRKLNSAFALGAGPLLVQTIENNWKIPIDDYASVDFSATIRLVDIIGGVELDITEEERPYVNKYVKSLCRLLGGEYQDHKLKNAGIQHCDGYQALAYMRVRNIGYDYARTQRQRTVLEAILAKLKQLNVTQILDLAGEILPYVTHNLDESKVISLIGSAPAILTYKVVESRIPYDGLYYSSNQNLICDFPATIARLQSDIYGAGEATSAPSNPLKDLTAKDIDKLKNESRLPKQYHGILEEAEPSVL